MSDVIVTVIFAIFCMFIGAAICGRDYSIKLNTCAKQHNVYKRELIAVPKKEGA